MTTCIICHFATELDDMVLMSIDGRGVCLRCYERETGSELRMPKALRLAVMQTLESLEAA